MNSSTAPTGWRILRFGYPLGEASHGLSACRDTFGRPSPSTAATALGVAISLGPIDPIKALYWTAVVNGLSNCTGASVDCGT